MNIRPKSLKLDLPIMKTSKRNQLTTTLVGPTCWSARTRSSASLPRFRRLGLVLVLAFGGSIASGAAVTGKMFATPEDAVSALAAAANAQDTNALRAIFGPATEEIQNPDRVQAADDLKEFTSALNQRRQIARQTDSRCVLEVGENAWPFPVPIVKKDGRWFFDTEAGKEELINRRIGRNELMTLQVVRAYVEAQREYASKDRDGDEVLEYAQKLASSLGQTDGLYWPTELNGELSPLGPFVAEAQEEGYFGKSSDSDAGPQPYHGYYFKILTRQGKHAPGGKYDYVINGNMIGGFALVAWPVEYGESGVMTFIVNQQGRVRQCDLGLDTAKIARKMKAYDPDPSWRVSPD